MVSLQIRIHSEPWNANLLGLRAFADVITGFLVTQMVKTACNAGDPVSIPGSGRSPGEGNGCPLQYSGESHGQRSLAGCSLWGCWRNQGEAPELRSVWIRVTHRNKGSDTRGRGLDTHLTVCSPTERVQGRMSTVGRGAVGLARPEPGHRVMSLQAHGWSPGTRWDAEVDMALSSPGKRSMGHMAHYGSQGKRARPGGLLRGGDTRAEH